MRIYWYAPWPEDRGWVSRELAEQIAGDSDEVMLHVLEPTGAVPSRPGNGNVRVVANLPVARPARTWTPRWFADRTALVARRARRRNGAIRRLAPDVVHLQLLSRFTDTWMMPPGAVVATVHDALPHRSRLPAAGERFLLRRLYGMLDAIVVHHEVVGEQLRADFGVPGGRIHCIPLVVPANTRTPVPRSLSRPHVLFFGAFRTNKGITRLCDAIEMLASEPHLRFHFAGRGDAGIERTVERLAERDRRVTAEIGYVANDAKERLFRAASLVVLPYTAFTSQSAVLGDAYAAGTPVLVTDVGALGASVRTDRTGWVLESGDPADIAAAIRSAVADQGAWDQRSQRAAAVAGERSQPAIARFYRELYAALGRR